MLRRVDPNGEALVWCRKCSVYACAVWDRTKLMNWCRTEQTRENMGKRLKIILNFEGGGVPDRCGKGWNVEGEKLSHKERVQELQVGI